MNKSCWCTIMFCFASIAAFSQTRVVAEIHNFRNDKGVCKACLFNNPDSFNDDGGKPFKCVTIAIKNRAAEAVFNVPAGTYALFVFHDANGNNKMDKNFLGIPKEGYGASKNRLPFAGAPNYNDNKFLVDDKSAITLQLRIRNL
jgi:uncharacterized protein (DUF2141 family)